MLSIDDLSRARVKIAEQFVRQCRDGPQSTGLAAGIKACGQRLGETESPQRGLHGTAAAIRVLAAYDNGDARLLLPQLVRYIKERESVEPSKEGDRLRADSCNVIKISETLYALYHVDAAVAQTEELRRQLASTLTSGMVAGQGWSYYTDRPQTVEPLPTALAVQALATEGYPVNGPVQSLMSTVISNGTGIAAIATADVSVKVLCLYVLAFGRGGLALVSPPDLKKAFFTLWSQLSSLLKDHDIEQNVEYQREGEHHYVRVPWQLYLIALAAQLAPFRSFASRSAQSRLRSVLSAAASPVGFFYPHSGSRVSARTNAILYEVLVVIERLLPQVSWKLRSGGVVDLVINSRVTVWAARAVFFLIAFLSLLQWTQGLTTGLGALAPNILSALLLLLLSARRPR